MLPPLIEALEIDVRRLMHAGQELEINRVPPVRRGGRAVLRPAIA